jgi:hypothetical protein
MSFAVIEKVLDNGPADRTETLLLVAIAEHANDAGYAWPGIEKIAHRTRCCKRQAIRLIKKLSLDGWIITLPKSAGEGKKGNAYQFNLRKIADRESHDIHMSHEKALRAENKRRKSKSGDIQIAPEKSGDILDDSQVTFDKSQVTFHTMSGDISPFPILKNRHRTVIEEPSVEPSLLALTSIEVHAGVFELPLIGKQGEWSVPENLYQEMVNAYPGVSVIEQLGKMRGWLISNPKDRKTPSGLPRFINSWLARAQNQNKRGANAKPGRFDEITESSREALAILDRVDNGANRNVRSLDSGGAPRSIFESPDDSLVAQNSRRDR